FCLVVVAQSLRPREQRGRHQLHAVDQMVRRCADARLYQTAAEKPLSERGGGARWASPVLICGYRSPICRHSVGAPCARWRSARYGIGPVVVGIFAVSVYRLGKAAIKATGPANVAPSQTRRRLSLWVRPIPMASRAACAPTASHRSV